MQFVDNQQGVMKTSNHQDLFTRTGCLVTADNQHDHSSLTTPLVYHQVFQPIYQDSPCTGSWPVPDCSWWSSQSPMPYVSSLQPCWIRDQEIRHQNYSACWSASAQSRKMASYHSTRVHLPPLRPHPPSSSYFTHPTSHEDNWFYNPDGWTFQLMDQPQHHHQMYTESYGDLTQCRSKCHVTDPLPVLVGHTTHAPDPERGQTWVGNNYNMSYQSTAVCSDAAQHPGESSRDLGEQHGDRRRREVDNLADAITHQQRVYESTTQITGRSDTKQVTDSATDDVTFHQSSASSHSVQHLTGVPDYRQSAGASINRVVSRTVVVRPFVCSFCSSRFIDRSSLVRHGRVHTGLRPYKCPLCRAAFTQSGNLTRHIRAKHPSPPAAIDNASKQLPVFSVASGNRHLF